MVGFVGYADNVFLPFIANEEVNKNWNYSKWGIVGYADWVHWSPELKCLICQKIENLLLLSAICIVVILSDMKYLIFHTEQRLTIAVAA